jgi:hypothetical protein
VGTLGHLCPPEAGLDKKKHHSSLAGHGPGPPGWGARAGHSKARQKNGFVLGIPRPALRKKGWGNWGPGLFSGPPDRDIVRRSSAVPGAKRRQRNKSSRGVRGPRRGTPRVSFFSALCGLVECLRDVTAMNYQSQKAFIRPTPPAPAAGEGGRGGGDRPGGVKKSPRGENRSRPPDRPVSGGERGG